MSSPDRSPLETLLAAEGSVAEDPEPAWRDFVEHVVESLDVGPGTRVWDVGCGAGAFLYPLWENGYRVGGVDDSEARIALARTAMPEGVFVVGQPTAVDPAEPWDVVIASRGFAACADVDQARGLLARMAAKATHAVAILNVSESGEPGGTPAARAGLLRMLAEIGVTAVQFETAAAGRFHTYAKV
jgi:ubiquinone/menaquinone biosynthesis C-methylase UbiE